MKRSGSRLERLARFFQPRRQDPAEVRARRLLDPRRFAAAQALVSAYYGVQLFFAVGSLYSWSEYLAVSTLAPRWPVFWLRFVDLQVGVPLLLAFYLLVGLAAVPFCGYRWVRILAFVSALELHAFKFSFGSINHGDHLGVLLAFVLIFLPRGWRRLDAPKAVRAATLTVFAGCQGMILLIYSMSGMWKAGGLIEQLLKGETSYLAPSGLARQVAAKLLGAEGTSLLGPWLIEHAWIGWPLMIATLYVEFFSLWVVSRPSLHFAWGFGLILFHVSTYLTMGIGFVQNSLWLCLFLVFSPFRLPDLEWRRVLRDLPLFRW
ncbi:MAG: hypothetical protein KDD47_16635 [Acidobacteria bacterium]|nr:hypothetical protein [Acidobacteriota bacterium]